MSPRLDRIPVWPYERKLLWIVGAGYFFAFFDIVTISFAAPVIATQFHVSKATVTLSVTSSLIGYIIGAFADSTIADKWGRKLSLGISVAVFSVVPFVARALVPTFASGWRIVFLIGYFVSPAVIIVFGFIASMTIGLLVPMLYTYTAEHFPTSARATGVALSDGLVHIGGALAPLIVLGANAAWGFSASLLVMGISGLAAGALILFGIRATGRSLEAATA